jgi:hypothetical protein
MSTTATRNGTPAPEAQPVSRGWADLDCPCCGQQGGVSVSLEDLDSFTCSECDGEFDRSAVEEFIAKWTKVLAWIDLAPAK